MSNGRVFDGTALAVARLLLLGAVLAGCGNIALPSGSDPSGGMPEPSGTASQAGAEQLCVDTINQYRSTLALPALARWTAAEMCADAQARSDSATGIAHGAFGSCTELAQNECPGWPGPAETMTTGCLQAMWNEGPGDDFEAHGHYINMSNPRYAVVACGYFTLPSGKIWSVQDFR